jgi:hypothetical protein
MWLYQDLCVSGGKEIKMIFGIFHLEVLLVYLSHLVYFVLFYCLAEMGIQEHT